MRTRDASSVGTLIWRSGRPAVAALLLACQVSAADQATAHTPNPAPTPLYEPTGFGPAKFGMSLAEVWKIYPHAVLLRDNEGLGAGFVSGPYIDRLALRNQPVPGLAKPTTLELRFWKNQLWGVVVYFDQNDPEQVKAYLAKTFGPSPSRDPDNPVWTGTKVTTTGTYKEHWYASDVTTMSLEAGAWLRQAMNGTWTGETPEEKEQRLKRMAALTPNSGQAGAGTPTPGAR